ncbi:MAG: hypothetical protein ACRC0G_04530 [Fusobacteriaceae bacterium]
MIEEELEEEFEEVEDSTEEVDEEIESEEIVEEESEVELALDNLTNIGSKEEMEEYLEDILSETTSKETKVAINKLLAKLNKTVGDEEAEEVANQALISEKRESVMSELPITDKDFKELTAWVGRQSKEYQEQLSKATNYKNVEKADIIKAITEAHKNRLNSVGGLANIDNAGGSFGILSREEVMEKRLTINKTYKGQDRINKINELRKEATSVPKLREWAEIYFN